MIRLFKAVGRSGSVLAISPCERGEKMQPFSGSFKCRFCTVCAGYGCKGELPGMGGVDGSRTFILNCAAWNAVYESYPLSQRAIDSIVLSPSDMGIAPVTGAVQNIGFEHESDFYLPYVRAAAETGIRICIGDGSPDEKLAFGVNAVMSLQKKAYYFLKPYPEHKLFERIERVRPSAEAVGMDIDAYNIVTMRNQAKLERKTAAQIQAFRSFSKRPLMLKGIFTREDISLCQEVKPDIAVVSNHGGRVDTLAGSTAEFLQKYVRQLQDCCGEIWVDGGIRNARDVRTAKFLGAHIVLVARPFISALCSGGESKMKDTIKNMLF